jgi:hypothetical protein
MAGIMPALEADDDVGLLGQPINNLAFTFVSPLGADHDNICHQNDCSDKSDAGQQPTAPDNGWRCRKQGKAAPTHRCDFRQIFGFREDLPLVLPPTMTLQAFPSGGAAFRAAS